MKKAKKINIERYKGKWHEIASFPAWFQAGCTNTTANYTIKKDHIKVVNACKIGPFINKAIGKARPTEKDNVLEVSFFGPSSDYIIEYVDEDYQYALVGSSGKNYLWILARKKQIPEDVLKKLITHAKKKGYDTSRLKFTST